MLLLLGRLGEKFSHKEVQVQAHTDMASGAPPYQSSNPPSSCPVPAGLQAGSVSVGL